LSGRRRDIVREVYVAQWRWAGAGGDRWHPFDDDANSWLEQSYQEWQCGGGHARGTLQINGHMYEIDLEIMIQQSQNTGRERSIHRQLKRYEADSANVSPIPNMTPMLDNVKNTRCEARDIISKVTFGKDIHRLHFKWHPDANCEDSLGQMHTVVWTGFNLETKPQLSFWYMDDDGDLCTLVRETFHDCLSFRRRGVLNLVAEQASLLSGSKASPSTLTANLPSCAISIASPPSTPRKENSGGSPFPPIDEEYDSTWSMIELPTDSAK